MICFKLFKIKIYIWFSFFAIISLLLVLSRNDLIILGVFAGIIHEMGHITAFLIKGYPPREIHLEYSGIRLIPERRVFSLKEESLFLISGSAMNIICFIIFYKLFKLWAYIHLVLGIFNLLPVKSLDGGQLTEIIMQKLLGVKKGIIVSNIIFVVFGIFIVISGIFLFFKTGNFTLLLTVMHLLFLNIFAK